MVGLYLIYQTHENVSSDLRWSQPGGQMTDLGLLEKGVGFKLQAWKDYLFLKNQD